jgi:DNA-binding MarR family transcriptional regulator
VRSDAIGESFAMPRDANSLEELEAIIARITGREQRWEAIRRIAERIGLELAPDEIWLLTHLGRSEGPVPTAALTDGFAITAAELDGIAGRLAARGLAQPTGDGLVLTAAGREAFARMVAGYRARLAVILERWRPEEHAEVRAMLADFARGLVSDLPLAPAAAGR